MGLGKANLTSLLPATKVTMHSLFLVQTRAELEQHQRQEMETLVQEMKEQQKKVSWRSSRAEFRPP